MLSATPVNNRFNDLKNQLQLAYSEGGRRTLDQPQHLDDGRAGLPRRAASSSTIGLSSPRGAPPTDPADARLRLLRELLDSVTIARGPRKHIQAFYDTTGSAPSRNDSRRSIQSNRSRTSPMSRRSTDLRTAPGAHPGGLHPSPTSSPAGSAGYVDLYDVQGGTAVQQSQRPAVSKA